MAMFSKKDVSSSQWHAIKRTTVTDVLWPIRGTTSVDGRLNEWYSAIRFFRPYHSKTTVDRVEHISLLEAR